MKQEIDYVKFIERYLQGEMSREEIAWFEKELEGNENLKQELNLRKQVNDVLADKDMMDFKLQLDEIHQEIFEVTEKSEYSLKIAYRKVYYAATTLAFLVIVFSFYLMNRNYSNEKLLLKYYNPQQEVVTFRSADPNQSQLSKAMDHYYKKEYKNAIAIFEELLTEDKSQIGLNLYSGIAHMEIEEYKEANQKFNHILEIQPNPFVESAHWYLGMCYIMTNERQKAAEQFSTLVKDKGYYSKQAKEILKRID